MERWLITYDLTEDADHGAAKNALEKEGLSALHLGASLPNTTVVWDTARSDVVTRVAELLKPYGVRRVAAARGVVETWPTAGLLMGLGAGFRG